MSRFLPWEILKIKMLDVKKTKPTFVISVLRVLGLVFFFEFILFLLTKYPMEGIGLAAVFWQHTVWSVNDGLSGNLRKPAADVSSRLPVNR